MALADYVHGKPTLETARLLIRPLEGTDVPALEEWMPDESIYAYVAVRLGRPHQGRGYGTEALTAMVRFCFEHTELERLRAEVDIRNAASMHMLEKCGFARKGGVRQGKMASVRCAFFVYGLAKGRRNGEA